VPEGSKPIKAELREVRLPGKDNPRVEETGKKTVTVDFNPETLRVTYANTIEGKDQSGGSARQFTAKGSTKLAVELWFDVTTTTDVKDVRERTREVNHFLVPQPSGSGKKKVLAPPGVRFQWGSFLFDGVMESMDETLEFFSPEGRPLRARVGISITSQEIQFQIRDAGGGGAGGGTPGTEPRQQVRQNESVQQAVARGGGSPDDWPRVAQANGIENPRRPGAGASLDLGAGSALGR
jgi:hypothetical protein